MPHVSASLPARWTSEVKSLARLIVGFLMFRHGMEQVLGYPPALTDAASMSWLGVLKLCAFPGGILVMLGLFTRPVCFVLSTLYLAYWFVGPLQIGLLPDRNLFGARGPSDPILLTGFFLMYLAATGPGAWSIDRLLHGDGDIAPNSTWAAYALGALRIVAAFLFLQHGLEKVFGTVPLVPLRKLAAFLEVVGGPLLLVGLFTRPLAFLLSGQMAVAYFLNHAPDGFWASFRGPNQQAAILNCFLFLLLWRAGPGAWSLDGVRRRRREQAALAPRGHVSEKIVEAKL